MLHNTSRRFRGSITGKNALNTRWPWTSRAKINTFDYFSLIPPSGQTEYRVCDSVHFIYLFLWRSSIYAFVRRFILHLSWPPYGKALDLSTYCTSGSDWSPGGRQETFHFLANRTVFEGTDLFFSDAVVPPSPQKKALHNSKLVFKKVFHKSLNSY